MTTTQKNQTGDAGQNTAQDGQFEVGTIVHVAPESLLMAKNIREAKASPDLVKSIAAVGVLQPVVAVTTTDANGAPALLVRFGHRRTLAAVEVEATVPVYIAGADGDAKTDEVLRVIAQRDENTHRDGLTAADDLHVVEALIGLGLSAAQVTKQARMKRTDVDAAIAVSESKLARAASDRYESLTLDQLAVVAEFEDDPETVKALIAGAKEGKFEHVAQRARDDRQKAEAREALTTALTKGGVRIIDRPNYDSKTKALGSLKASHDAKQSLTFEPHAECPGHVAWIDYDWFDLDMNGDPLVFPDEPDEDADEAKWDAYEEACERIKATARRVQRPVAAYGCESPSKYGHVDRYSYGSPSTKPKASEMSEAEREKAKKARALVIENNKAWEAAQPVRREWLRTFAARKTPPKGTGAFLATALSVDHHTMVSTGGNALACDWLGVKHTGYGWADLSPAKTATENRALVITLVQVLADYEAGLTNDSWRQNGTQSNVGRYLRFLQAAGYDLSDVEKYAISKNTA